VPQRDLLKCPRMALPSSEICLAVCRPAPQRFTLLVPIRSIDTRKLDTGTRRPASCATRSPRRALCTSGTRRSCPTGHSLL